MAESFVLMRLTVTDSMSLLADPLVHEDGELKMKFKLVTRKGNKQQVGSHDNHTTTT